MNKETKPLITTIIPTYRRPKLLKRAIQSVLNQTYPHFQVCVYDNASGDETAEVVTEFEKKDSRVKYYCHPENIGALANFNYGMAHVETPFFSFLSDDDILLPDFYETAMENFEKYPESIFSTTATIVTDINGNILNIPTIKWESGFYQPPDGLFYMFKNGHHVWTSILFRKEVIEKIGVLDKEIFISDIDFQFRIAARYSFSVSNKVGAIFVRQKHPSWAQLEHVYPGWLKIIQNLTEDELLSSSVRGYIARILTERLKKILLRMVIRSIMQEDFRNAYEAIKVLRNHYCLTTATFFLSFLAFVCKHFPLVNYIGVSLNKFRLLFNQNKYCEFQEMVFETFSTLK